MTKTYTVTLTDAEDRAMLHVASDVQEWLNNIAHHRAEQAMDEIVTAEIKRRLDAGLPIPQTKDDIVLSSSLPTAADRHEEHLAAFAASQAAPQ
jgi:hypothetical protein